MKKINIYLLIMTLTGFIMNVRAQNPLSLYYLENIPQTTLLNPAMVPRTNFFFGVPGVNTIYTNINSDITSGIIQEHDGEMILIGMDGYDYTDIYKSIGDAANITSVQSMAPLMFGFKTKHGYFTFSWTEKLGEELSVPRDVFKVMEEGYVEGTTYDFSLLGTESHYYREISLGYSFKWSKSLRVGLHAKFLQGLAAIKSDIKDINFMVGLDESEISLNGDVYMSAPVYISYDDNGLPIVDSIPSDLNSLLDKGVFNFSNPGFAVDIGAIYSLKKFEFSVALNDAGFIAWNGEDHNRFYANGSYTFKTLGDTLDQPIEDLIDSIKIAVNFSHEETPFKTAIAPKLYLGARYRFNQYFSMGFLSRTVFSRYITRQEFNFSANMNLYHLITASLNYTMTVKGINALGAGAAIRLGPLQVYAAMDYVPDKISKNTTIDLNINDVESQLKVPVIPDRFSDFNVMFGVNLLFGANGYHDKALIAPSSSF